MIIIKIPAPYISTSTFNKVGKCLRAITPTIKETHSRKTLFEQSFNNSSDWIPITINALIRVSIPQGYLYANLHIGFGLNSSGILDGAGYSTFFIKYIGEL